MSKALSLKMDERVFLETERVLKRIRMPRNAYINQAIDFYNRWQGRRLIKRQLRKEVGLLKDDTHRFVTEFALLEDLHE